MIKTVLLALITTSLTTTALAGEIKGRQYLVLGSGPKAIADNEILFIPCAPVNSNCLELRDNMLLAQREFDRKFEQDMKKINEKTKTLIDEILNNKPSDYKASKSNSLKTSSASVIAENDDRVKLDTVEVYRKLLKSEQIQSIRTDFDGNFTFSCPTQNCLVFSRGEVGLARAKWMVIVPSNSIVDLSSSNTFNLWNKTR